MEESKYEWALVTDAEVKLVNKLLVITEVVKDDVMVAMDAVVLISKSDVVDDSDVVETDEAFVEESEVEVVKIVAVEVNMVGESIFAELDVNEVIVIDSDEGVVEEEVVASLTLEMVLEVGMVKSKVEAVEVGVVE